MRYEEERLSAALEELKTFSAKITDKDALADLAVITAGFETMRPYLSVGLKVCPSSETLEAMNRLQASGIFTQELWNSLMKVVELARQRPFAEPVKLAVRRSSRRVTSRALIRPPVLKS